jgi:AcrR family transcriptional regulator
MEQAKRECILLAAAKAFSRFGFRKASVDEIARSAGVAKGTVYLAAESKEDLFYQVLHREVRAWVAQVAGMIDPRVPADQLLERLSRNGFDYLDQHPLVRDLLFGKANEILPTWSERLAELRALGAANVVEVLRLGVKQKRFRSGLDLEAVASLLQDLQIASYLFIDAASEGTERRRQAALDLVLNGLREPASP